jgi:hypothetical protein
VFDSSTKIPEGLLVGNTVHLGNFDECLEVNVNEDWGSFKGQHCMASVTMNVDGFVKEVWYSSVALSCGLETDIVLHSSHRSSIK